MRHWEHFQTNEPIRFRSQLLSFCQLYKQFAFLDSCGNHVYGETTFDVLAGVGRLDEVVASAGEAFQAFNQFRRKHHDWMFGFFAYDLKNEVEVLHSEGYDGISLPDMIYFVPSILVRIKNNVVEIGTTVPIQQVIWEQICSMPEHTEEQIDQQMMMHPRMSKAAYLDIIDKIRNHIIHGDIYEMNFCQEFYAEKVQLNPFTTFDRLCRKSKAPFSVLFGWNDHYLISASPERFLRKRGKVLQSQPIKGTRRRSAGEDDRKWKEDLAASVKDRAEHMMIVDLVRNDLTPFARTGSVGVDELMGIYSFEQVHQMVSTISAELKDDADVVPAVKQAFPMGSMTGAPKVKAMQLIEQYEPTKRGVFSGAFGYWTPENDFDLNVVIRSMLYNSKSRYLSIQVGGAIVYDSDPMQEFEECLLKASALFDILQAKLIQQ
jgi:para-aminobenzoate synthetase component 1